MDPGSARAIQGGGLWQEQAHTGEYFRILLHGCRWHAQGFKSLVQWQDWRCVISTNAGASCGIRRYWLQVPIDRKQSNRDLEHKTHETAEGCKRWMNGGWMVDDLKWCISVLCLEDRLERDGMPATYAHIQIGLVGLTDQRINNAPRLLSSAAKLREVDNRNTMKQLYATGTPWHSKRLFMRSDHRSSKASSALHSAKRMGKSPNWGCRPSLKGKLAQPTLVTTSKSKSDQSS